LLIEIPTFLEQDRLERSEFKIQFSIKFWSWSLSPNWMSPKYLRDHIRSVLSATSYTPLLSLDLPANICSAS